VTYKIKAMNTTKFKALAKRNNSAEANSILSQGKVEKLKVNKKS